MRSFWTQKVTLSTWTRPLGEAIPDDEDRVRIGVDAGTCHLRLVHLHGQQTRLDRAVLRSLPADERERGAALRTSLREMLGGHGGEYQVTVGMQGARVFTRHLHLPRMSPQELSVAVPIEVENSLPFPLDDAMHGFVVGEALDRDPTRRGVTFVAAPRSTFSPLLNLLRELTGVQNVTMEIPAFALARLTGVADGNADSQFTVLVDVGARFTHVGFAREGMVYQARDFEAGGEDFTRSLQVARGLTRDQAEQMKVEEPLLDDPRRRSWLEPSLTRWTREVQRSVEYFRYRLPVAPLRIDRLLLTGGGALLQGLGQHLSTALEVPLAPFPGLTLEGEEHARAELAARPALFHVAAGLALRPEKTS